MPRSPEKSDGAFRTIREVADWLGVPTHVLRFWESKFEQIAPVKGAGGRRYYRPDDMRLLGGIKVMLHDQGMTIRAVSQRIDEEGLQPVMALSPELDASEGPPARTRRVIRKGEPAEAEAPAPVEIAKDPASLPEELLPEQPTDAEAPLEEAPVPAVEPGLPDAPAPEPAGTPLDAEPPGTPETPLPDAPADPAHQVRHAPDPDPVPDPAPEPEPVMEPDPAPDLSGTEEAVDDPLARARALVAASGPVSPEARKRLRRVVRRYRALAEEIADDLAEGDGS